MKLSTKLSIILFPLVITFSCTSDDVTDNDIVEPINNFAELSGTWTGETRILQAGDCISFDKSWIPVELDLVVDENGNAVVIEERQYYTQDMTWHVMRSLWEGVVLENDSLFLSKTFIIDCSGTDNTEVTDYATKLIRTGNSIEFRINEIEVFCPDQNCVFDRDYVLSKS